MTDNNIGTTKFGATPMTKEQKNNVEAQFKMDSTLMHLQDTLGQALKSVEEISYDVDTQPATHSQMNKSIEVLKGIQDSVDLLTSEPKADSELRKSTDFLREAVVEGFKVLGDVSVMNSKTITDSISNHINDLQDEVSNLTFSSDELDVNVDLNDYGIEVDISKCLPDIFSEIELNQDQVVEKIDGSIDAIESVSNQINSNSNILKTFLNRVLESLIVKGKEYDSESNPDNQEKEFRVIDVLVDTLFWTKDISKSNARIAEALETQNRLQKEMMLYMVDMKKNVSNIATSINFVKKPLDNNR